MSGWEQRNFNSVHTASRAQLIARHSWAQRYVIHWVREQDLQSESPVSTACEPRAQVKNATSRAGLKGRWCVRKMLAEIWVEIARYLDSGSQTRERDAAYAATRAVAQLPSYIMQMILVRMIVRGMLSSFHG